MYDVDRGFAASWIYDPFRVHTQAVPTVEDRLAGIRETLLGLEVAADDRAEALLETGLMYAADHPIPIRVRKRGRRFDLTDNGAAVRRAGKPAGWLERCERLVADQGFNINRRGVVFVPVVAGRDVAALALRLAAVSRNVYLELLEADE